MIDVSDGREFSATLKDNLTGEEPLRKTEIRIKTDDEGLKLLFILDDDDIIASGEGYNDKLYEGDVAEMMLTLGGDDKYLELEVNPNGIGYSAIGMANENGTAIKLIWDFEFEYEVYRTETGWMTEWYVSFAELKKYGFDIGNVRANFYRQDRRSSGALKLQALYPTGTRSFHCPEKFGVVKMI